MCGQHRLLLAAVAALVALACAGALWYTRRTTALFGIVVLQIAVVLYLLVVSTHAAAFIHHVDVPGLVVDDSKKILDANLAATSVFGGGLTGLACTSVLPTYDRDFFGANGTPRRCRLEGVCHDGSTLHLVAHRRAFRSNRYTLLLVDISSEVELHKKVLAQFVHEMRNKYTAAAHILEVVDGLMSSSSSSSGTAIHRIEDELSHREVKQSIALLNEADQLVQTRLELHRIYNGHYVSDANVQTLELTELMQSRVAAAAALASPAVDFSVQLPDAFKDSDVFVRIDMYMWQHIANNLLSNARKHTTTGSVVFALAEVSDTMLIFSVTDTGRGIADDVAARLFTEEVSSADVRGVGMGLVSCRKFARIIGGDCWLEQTRLRSLEDAASSGSQFRFSIPARIVKTQAREDVRTLAPAAPLRNVATVVIVEDSAIIRKSIRTKLTSLFGDVSFDEHETVESVLPLVPDLADRDDVVITVDQSLDSKGGVLTGSDLITSLTTIGFKGIIISVSGDDRVGEQHKLLGAHACIGKPLPRHDDIKRTFEDAAAAALLASSSRGRPPTS